jgi:LSU ribosomal protein L6P
MSRIGNQTITIPDNVDFKLENSIVTVSGPNGELTRELHPVVKVNFDEDKSEVTVDVDNKNNNRHRSMWGTYASHISNMVEGVTDGFKKELEINGVGYRVKMKGTDVEVEVGFSEPVVYEIPEEIDADVDGSKIIIEGADKELVGKVAAEIRSIRPPEPYKGKGIKYVDEEIRRKEGKTATGEMGAGA